MCTLPRQIALVPPLPHVLQALDEAVTGPQLACCVPLSGVRYWAQVFIASPLGSCEEMIRWWLALLRQHAEQLLSYGIGEGVFRASRNTRSTTTHSSCEVMNQLAIS